MLTKIKVLLHICTNITQNPEKITESLHSFGAFKVSPIDGSYREIEDYTINVELPTPNDLIKVIADIPFHFIFNCTPNSRE